MADEHRMAAVRDAPWPPPGSSAEVWVGQDCSVPEPVIVARLLVVRTGPGGVPEFFCVPTPKGPNLPTRYSWADFADEPVHDGVANLMREVTGRTGPATRCIGFLRNVVPNPNAVYPYPSPWAQVPVFLVTDAVHPVVAGSWFDAGTGRPELANRHWWPIVEHHLQMTPPRGAR